MNISTRRAVTEHELVEDSIFGRGIGGACAWIPFPGASESLNSAIFETTVPDETA